MDKLRMQTADGVADNINKLLTIFPDCATEVIGVDGKPKRAVDFDKLRQNLSPEIVEGNQERYQFTWPDKRKAILLANSPINATLRPCREESVDFDNTQNLYIEGDNLDVLKCLKETYLGKVKMIYIDPPYNTGNDFVYEDDFASTTEDYLQQSGQYDDQGNRLFTNSESNGRFHTDWLNMIYPRLKVAKDLLTDDGVIFISIDDNEVENLKKVCDEVFGEDNCIGELIWQTATDNNPRQITIEHEYVLCYAKNKLLLSPWIISSTKAQLIHDYYLKELKGIKELPQAQKQLRLWMKEHKSDLQGIMHYDCIDEKGVYTANTNSSNTKPGGYTYDILHPITGKPCAKPAYGWRWAETTFWKYEKEGDVAWGVDETTQPHIKKRIETATELLKSIYYEDGRASTLLLETLFGRKKIFENPKAMGLIQRIVDFSCQDKNAFILDFFSGSATTAHAVMQINAKDGGKRKFIMVQIPEISYVGKKEKYIENGEQKERYIIDENTGYPKIVKDSEARKASYWTICEIGKERIRRAGKKIKEDNKDKEGIDKLDIGFRVLKLDSTNMLDVYYAPNKLVQEDLFEQADNVKTDRTGEDLLFQVMLELGITLDNHISEETISGHRVYNVNDGYLLACFEKDVTDDVVKAIAKRQPVYAVLRDASLKNDSTAANFEQIFKTYSPDTERRIL